MSELLIDAPVKIKSHKKRIQTLFILFMLSVYIVGMIFFTNKILNWIDKNINLVDLSKKESETYVSTIIIGGNQKEIGTKTFVIQENKAIKNEEKTYCDKTKVTYEDKVDYNEISKCDLILDEIATNHCNLFDELKLIKIVKYNKKGAGSYNPWTGTINIEICDKVVIYHELGHNVWKYKLSRYERKKWCELWKNAEFFVTRYASTKCEEDFAESLAYFVVYPFDIDRERSSLISEYIKR